jgi:hypothetical protein
MKKVAFSLLLAGALVLGSAGAALAGETTGAELRGKGTQSRTGTSPTPKAPTVAKSECVYSGLDTPDAIEGNPEGFDDDALMIHGTQSYGQFIANGFGYIVEGFGPGVACKGAPALAK